jgi:hypothetical protein
METIQKISLQGVKKIARAKFRAKSENIMMAWGGMVLVAGSLAYWVLFNTTSTIAFALPIAIGIVFLVYLITKQEKFVDKMIEKWSENGCQLPENLLQK